VSEGKNSLSHFIEVSVRRFLQNNRIGSYNEVNLKELDNRIHFEAFLREKKAAIRADRQAGLPLEDITSQTSRIQEKYAALNAALEETRLSRCS